MGSNINDVGWRVGTEQVKIRGNARKQGNSQKWEQRILRSGNICGIGKTGEREKREWVGERGIGLSLGLIVIGIGCHWDWLSLGLIVFGIDCPWD